MASVQLGTKAIVWSMATTMSGTNVSTGLITSVDYAMEADEKAIKGADGATEILVFADQRQTCTVEVVPSSSAVSGPIAAAKLQNILPEIGDIVTVVDADDAEVAGTTWIFTGGSKRKSVDDNVVLTMNLRRYSNTLALKS